MTAVTMTPLLAAGLAYLAVVWTVAVVTFLRGLR